MPVCIDFILWSIVWSCIAIQCVLMRVIVCFEAVSGSFNYRSEVFNGRTKFAAWKCKRLAGSFRCGLVLVKDVFAYKAGVCSG